MFDRGDNTLFADYEGIFQSLLNVRNSWNIAGV